jgi:hypothetical protein
VSFLDSDAVPAATPGQQIVKQAGSKRKKETTNTQAKRKQK